MTIQLKDNTQYIDGYEHRHLIVGPTKDYSDWVYSRGGHWFERETGRRISFTPEQGHYVLEGSNRRHLVKEGP